MSVLNFQVLALLLFAEFIMLFLKINFYSQAAIGTTTVFFSLFIFIKLPFFSYVICYALVLLYSSAMVDFFGTTIGNFLRKARIGGTIGQNGLLIYMVEFWLSTIENTCCSICLTLVQWQSCCVVRQLIQALCSVVFYGIEFIDPSDTVYSSFKFEICLEPNYMVFIFHLLSFSLFIL